MSFEEINLVIPCIEAAFDYGYTDLQAEQVAAPRVYKTHFWYRDTPKGAGKYIYVTRDPLDVGPSFYYFLGGGWYFEEDEISLEQFLEEFWLRRGEAETPMQNASHWHNLASWYPHRAEANVLWLHYEDLHEDLPACVDLIADFLGFGGDAEAKAVALQQAHIDHMKLHPTKYDEHMLKLATNERCGRRRDAGLDGRSSKVREGKVKRNRQELTPALKAGIQQKWEEVVTPVTGAATYDELRTAINRELGRPFASTRAAAAAVAAGH
ncbi:MAG: P-loop containing nucleoside triphosphate hydrolase protein [Monoraphidium minutum]|nr:MAG: P-loop containing nucleoside triphosphate hydrolase protein [Monoraphidium minutum]